jgi:glycosyltransferase involved in cell wall biosynthesis
MLAALGRRPAAEIRVGPDHEAFATDVAPEKRAGRACGFPVRPEWFKGSGDAAAAAVRVKARIDEVTFRAFGRFPSPGLPSWIDYLFRPTDAELRQLYNSVALFVLPSHYEAWPLPGLEAMACGAALVCADSVGVRGYARHGENALLVPAGRPDLLAEAIEGLIRDEARRMRLANAGRQTALGYRWDEAVTRLEAVLAG